MTFLPIASRELRVAARKRSTFWLRVIAAVIGMVLGGGFMLMSSFQPTGLPSMGRALFGSLTWMSVIAALATGIFFTADCLSEEKREGTLGFLFLTDLRGYDVVLGKLSATSLRGWFALLALFPVLAVTLLMGGVTGVQFWKATLALANALFFSLATGLFVSSLGRDSQRVMAATLFLLIILAGGGPICDAVIAGVKHRGFIPVWSVTSPAFAFSQANAWGRSPFWRALVLSHLIAWALLALACGLVPKTWQERGRKSTGSMRGWAYAFKYGPAKQRGRLRRKLLERHPVMWLASRERWQAVAIWIIALLVSGMAGYAVFGAPREVWFVWNLMGTLFTTLIYFWAASQSCRFFVEARRSGLVELLLASPVTEKELVRGQWRALLRTFGLPVLLLIAVQVTGAAMSQNFWKAAAQAGSTNQIPIFTLLPITTAVLSGLTMLANLAAIGWFGMWMGFTSKNATLATLKTFVFVQIVPAMVISLGATMATALMILPWAAKMGAGAKPGPNMLLFPFVSLGVSSLLALAKDTGFVLWSRKHLYYSFRERAARGFSQAQFIRPPLAPPRIPAPPPIIPISPNA